MKINKLAATVEETISATSPTGLAVGAIASHALYYYRTAIFALERLEKVYASSGCEKEAENVRVDIERLNTLAERGQE
jgi:hypothetical protein